MTVDMDRPSDRPARWTSKSFWLGVLLAGAACVVAVGQMDLFSVDADDAPGETTAALAGGKILAVALRAENEVATAQTAKIEAARDLIAEAGAAFAKVDDYTCTFVKRERIGGRLNAPHIMDMKVRTRPSSIYFKFRQPDKGREAIYIAGKNDGKVLAHDVGFGKLLGGTMWLDPKGMFAMVANRHPITEAGLAELIATVTDRWNVELSPEVSDITIDPEAEADGRRCVMVDSTHPVRRADFFFYKVRLFFDKETALPIRFEAYDWPKTEGATLDLVEEYTYSGLKTNVGLADLDFDTANPAYSFGRF